MPIAFANADISFNEAKFTFQEFSLAYELFLARVRYKSRDLINQYLDVKPKKKKKVIELILKVKGQTIKDDVKIPNDVNISLSNIDLVIQEVLKKPMVNIYAT